ncbi:MAG: hypothetical protein ACI8P0_003821 [Planctomycetaceae bacterium]|jgi:hypothetical protein
MMRNELAGKAVLACFLLTADSGFAQNDRTESKIGFNDQIRPILSEYCFACHGPDSASRKAELRLDQRESAIDAGAVEPGKPHESELIARILSDDPAEMMPPPATGKTLTVDEKRILQKWIKDGAEWEAHWAFIRPERPENPEFRQKVKYAPTIIDAFILRKLDELGLQPNPRADRYTIARRAALDLTGLPPTPKMLDTFVWDSQPAAFFRYVDTLLTSKHAGEHRARFWLDAARYGDTHGMHVDNYREMWPYRDWVVNAFNSNMPFDQFVVEQIAGDMLPAATLEQQIATGFNRCNITTSEGGAIPAELEVRYMVDRVETMATVFLGMTAGCAVCHDHKFDPLSQREFYQLGAFFNNSTAQVMDGNQKDTPPVITLPSDEFKDEWDALNRRRAELKQRLSLGDPNSEGAAERWWNKRSKELEQPIVADDLLLSLPLTEEARQTVKLTESTKWAEDHPGGRRGLRFDTKSEFQTKLPALRSDEPLTVSFWFRTPDKLLSTTIFNHTAATKDKKTAGWKISSSTQGALTFELIDANGKKIRGLLPGEEALTPRAWQHVCVRYSGGQSNSSISIFLNGRRGILRNSSEDLIEATDLPAAPLKIASRVPTAGLSDVRIFRRWVTDNEVQLLTKEFELKPLLASKSKWSQLKPEQQQLAADFRAANIDKQGQAELRELANLQKRHDYIYSRSTTTLVMQERTTRPRAWVLQRGEYDQRLEEVGAGVPNVLPPLPAGSSANRLALARWLVDPAHPLTARVMVNRLWQSLFGTGLVRTSEDFGVMGERPSHPELLDWLAVEFVESGWNVNHILKLIVASETYQQSGAATEQKLEVDRDNRYLSRGPRVRLDAEVLRDQALAVSGMLVRRLGGPTVKPYQPAGLWKVVAITGSNTRIFEKDSGEALYRRSLYTFWKRTAPPPTMAAFNAPTREQCTVRRERTNTPIQALVLMNSPQFIEAARHLAESAIRENEALKDRAEWMFQRTLSRPATPADVDDMLAVAEAMHGLFKKDPKLAGELIRTGDSQPDESLAEVDVAAWTMVANTLMNRDDFISK